MIKIFRTFGIVLLLMTLPSFAIDTDTCDLSSVTQPVEVNDVKVMNDNLAQSEQLLIMSQNLLSISVQLLSDASGTNSTYVFAMLRLSDDIGKMADRIGEMADRIVATELQIGLMADRILETQRIQNHNIALTQANLLKAQENFNKLLVQLAK
ncbi:hypothetical protein [Hydrogenimonas sp. SS33]|uniref:hypothetical protein n=1 Tax=Hydrogenimonas leucolamina TaxID=2954236 RepID=UPI00336C11B5